MRTDSKEFKKQLKNVNKNVDSIGYSAYKYFKSITPIDKGNARRNTVFRDKTHQKEIIADYPYSERLNTGYSDQAPQGMVKPTLKYIKQLFDRIIRNNSRG